MAIEQLGESLLSQARKKSKKGRRKVNIFTGLMLGAHGANIILRKKANKI